MVGIYYKRSVAERIMRLATALHGLFILFFLRVGHDPKFSIPRFRHAWNFFSFYRSAALYIYILALALFLRRRHRDVCSSIVTEDISAAGSSLTPALSQRPTTSPPLLPPPPHPPPPHQYRKVFKYCSLY